MVTCINDVVHSVQRNPRPKMMVVHLERLAHYQELLGTSGLKEGAIGK
jgi:hypothetical protein